MARKFLNGVQSYFNNSNYTQLGYDSLDVVGGDLLLKRAGDEKLRIGADTSTFSTDVRLPNSGKLYLWNDHNSNYLMYDRWRASASGGMNIQNVASTGEIYLRSNNALTLTLDGTGQGIFENYLGIGGNTPTVALDVKGPNNLSSRFIFTKDGTTDKILFGGADHDDFDTFVGSSSNHSFTITQNGAAAITINTSKNATFAGKVGIGSAPSTRGLEVSGAGALGTILASDGTVNTVLWGDASGSNHGGVGTDNNYGFNIYQNGGVAIEIDTSKNATFAGQVEIPDLFVNCSANINSSSEKLSVNGMSLLSGASDSAATLYVKNTSTTANTFQPYIFFADPGGNRAGFGVETSTAKLKINSQNAMLFTTGASSLGGTLALTLDTSQNATFAGKMVVGDATDQQQWIVNKAVAGYFSGIKLTRGAGNNSSTANNNHAIWVSDTGLNFGKTNDATVDAFSNVSTHLTLNASGNATFAGSVHLDNDSAQLQFGDDNDMQIYHNGANGVIDNNTGDLIIRSDSDDIKILAEDDVVIRDNDDSTEMAKFINGGAVELYYNGSKKFETTSAGIKLSSYGAGYLKTDANGNVSVDASIIEDTLQSVTDRGSTTTNTMQGTRLGLGAAPHASAALQITTTAQHMRLNNGSELGVIHLLSGGELEFWAHGDGETINFRTGSGAGSLAAHIDGIDTSFEGKVSVGGGDTSTAQVALKGQQSLLSFERGTSGDAKFFMSSDSARLYFSHTDIQSTNLILTLNDDENAIFAGNVDVDGGTLNVGSSNEVSIVSSGSSLFPSLKVNNNGYVGSASVTDALQFKTSGYLKAKSRLAVGSTDPEFALHLSNNAGSGGLNSGVMLEMRSSTATDPAGMRFVSQTGGSTNYMQNLYDGANLKWKHWSGSAYVDKITFSNAGAATFAGEGIFNGGLVNVNGTTTSALAINASTHNTNVANEATLSFSYGHSGGAGTGHIKLTEDANNSFAADMTFGLPYNNGSGGSSTRTVLTLDGSDTSATFAGNVTVGTGNLSLSGNGSITTGGYWHLISAANGNGYLDAGGTIYIRDKDAGNADRVTIDTATGNLTVGGTYTAQGDKGNTGFIQTFRNTNTGGGAYVEALFGQSGSSELRIGHAPNYGSANWNASWVYAVGKPLFLKSSSDDVVIYAGGAGSSDIVATFDTNQNTTFTGNISTSSVGGDGAPILDITGTASATFNWISKSMHANLTAGETNIHLFGQHASTKNSGYIGYTHSGDSGSNNNKITLGMYGANHLLTISPTLATFDVDTVAPGVYVGSRNTSYDFYNNGTSYLNGSTTIDDTLYMTGTQAQVILPKFKGVRLHDNTTQVAFDLPYFTNGVSNLAADILLGNTTINGIIELTLTSTYSHQNAVGEARFKWIVGFNADGSIWYTPQLIERRITHQSSQIYVTDPAWDSTNSRYYIRVYHKNSAGNAWEGNIKYFSGGVAQNLQSNISVTGLLTNTSTTASHPIGHYLSDQTGDMNLILESKAAGDPTLTLTSQAVNRTGIINFQDQGVTTGQIQYLHNGDTMKFVTGGTGSSHEELTLNETNGAVFRTKMAIGSTSVASNINYVLDVKKGYQSGYGHVAYFGAGANTIAKLNFDTVVVAQDDVPCLAIVEGNNGNHHATEQALRLAVGDNNAVISSTVSGGLRFFVNRSTNVPGYQINDGVQALYLANNGTATFAGHITNTVTSGSNIALKKGDGTGALAFGGTAHQTGLIEGVDGGGLKLYTAGNDVAWDGAWSLNTTWSGQNMSVNGSVTAGSLIKSGGTGSQFLMADGTTSTHISPNGHLNMNDNNIDNVGDLDFTRSFPFNVASKDYDSSNTTGYSTSGSSYDDWIKIANFGEAEGATYLNIKSDAHSSFTCVMTRGYHSSNAASLTLLNSTHNPNSTYAQPTGIRIIRESDGSGGSSTTYSIQVRIHRSGNHAGYKIYCKAWGGGYNNINGCLDFLSSATNVTNDGTGSTVLASIDNFAATALDQLGTSFTSLWAAKPIVGESNIISKASISVEKDGGELVLTTTGNGHGSINTTDNKDLNIAAASGNVYVNDDFLPGAAGVSLGSSSDRFADVRTNYLDSNTASTTDPVLRLTDSGVADYDVTFPDTSTYKLSTNTSSTKNFHLANAGSGAFTMEVDGRITAHGDLKSTGGKLDITGAGSFITHGTSWGTNLKLTNTNDDASPPVLTFLKHQTSGHSAIADNDYVGFINYRMKNTNGDEFSWVELSSLATDVTDGSESSAFRIGTWGAGTELANTIYASSNTNGPRVGIGTASPDKALTVYAPTYAGIDIKTASGKLWEAEQWYADEGYQGMYKAGTKTIQFRADGESYFNSGKLGVGTGVNIDTKFHVEESTANTACYAKVQAASWDAGLVLQNGHGTWEIINDYTGLSTTGSLAFYGHSAYRMVLDNAGNLMLGATALNGAFGASNTVLAIKGSSSGGEGILQITGLGNNASDNVGRIDFHSQAEADAMAAIRCVRGNADDVGELEFYTNSGGNSAPTKALTIDTNQNAVFTAPVWVPDYIYHTGDSNTYFGFSGADTYVVAAGGTSTLQVTSGVVESSGKFASGNGVVGAPAFTFASDLNTGMYRGGSDTIAFSTGGSLAFTIASNGECTAVGDVVAFSDKKLKKNIKTLDGSKVYEMRGVSFDRIDTDKASSGVIAQEIQKIAPELVSETDGTLGVSYGNLTGYLIEAIKDLKAEIEDLKKQIK